MWCWNVNASALDDRVDPSGRKRTMSVWGNFGELRIGTDSGSDTSEPSLMTVGWRRRYVR